ncbi:hypothetical protein O2W15_07380 [Modestobacter sp. VKM Ac-2979]|uniref:hypothetical protein n=1 Tax=unclassified Modestobacter TaxID=2643866 RepID=UPI0022ABA214|nr:MULTISPECIES: hypothetical protein [unclassified Modestobacter]MCZ2811258.1 hypothetical protein [Modestobacter sp. VKM Ac-2979]MCZ2840771.1 hypothetical protein [Modestobacter sp. VKM Ac-2980]
MTGGIRFAGAWGGLSQVEQRRMAKDDAHPLPYRVYFAALGRANRVGHAEFSEGELRHLLRRADGTPRSEGVISNAIAEAKRKGLIHRDSGARCLVLSSQHFQKAGSGSSTCDVHGIRWT